MNALGTHLLLELRQCNEALLDDLLYIEEAMVGAALEAGATILAKSFHKFDPRGVTGIIAISESHLAIHTWPEHGYAAVDIFTCGTTFERHKASRVIIDRMGSKEVSTKELKRGLVPEITPTAV